MPTDDTRPLSDAGLARFDDVAAGHVGPHAVPGLAALVASGDQVHTLARGALTIGGAPVRRDSLFRIASTTKPIAAAATLRLIEEGRFAIDDPVDDLLPELANPRVLRRADGPLADTVPARRPITVADLLTGRSGLGMHVDMFSSTRPWPIVAREAELGLNSFGPPQPQQKPAPGEWVAALGSLPLLAQPGTRWLYQTPTSVLGVLAERATGAPFAELLAERILDPLGMRDTAFWTSRTDRLATCYGSGDVGLSVLDPPDGQWSGPPAFADAASGLVSTVDDLLAFARMLLRGGAPVLESTSVEAMCRNQITAEQAADGAGFLDGCGWGYCQSVHTDGPRAGAFGWDGGLGTSWLVDPVRELVVIVLTQRAFDSPQMPDVHEELRTAAYAALRRSVID